MTVQKIWCLTKSHASRELRLCLLTYLSLAPMPENTFEDDEALLNASRNAYKASSREASGLVRGSETFEDSTDLLTFDSAAPRPPNAESHGAVTVKRQEKSKAKEPPEMLSSLQMIEQEGALPTKKPSKRETQEVCMHF